MDDIIAHHINGEAVYQTHRLIPVHNPTTAEIIGNIDCADERLINQAVEFAKKAQLIWAKTPAIKRAKVLRDFAQIIEKK